jgi:hypothetical protein
MSSDRAGGITGVARALEHAGLVAISTAATPPLVRHKRPMPSGRIGGSRLPAATVPGAERAAPGAGWVRAGHAAGERARTLSAAGVPACPGVARAGRALARRIGVAG